MFRGVTQLNLDNKGRLAVPAKYRDSLITACAGHLVITVDSPKCLLIYPKSAWEPIEQKLSSLSSFHPQIRSLQRLLIGNANDVEMDSAGRILVSLPLRQFAELTKNVVLVGQGAKFELWDEEKWNQQIQDSLTLRNDDMSSELYGFSL